MKPQQPFLRRHAVGASVAGAALTLGLVAGGCTWGVSAALADTPSPTVSATPLTPTSATVSAPTPTPTPSAKPAHHHAKRHRIHGVRGTIAKIDGDTWTVHTKAGATVTVKISSSTAFGTKKAPAARSSFAVGDRIGALGKRHDKVVTAKRIVHLPVKTHTSTPTPGQGS